MAGLFDEKKQRDSEVVQQKMAGIQEFQEHCDKYDEPGDRVVGHVVASPVIRLGPEEFHLDWAIVALDENEFGPTLPSNHIPIANFNSKIRDTMHKTSATRSIGDPQRSCITQIRRFAHPGRLFHHGCDPPQGSRIRTTDCASSPMRPRGVVPCLHTCVVPQQRRRAAASTISPLVTKTLLVAGLCGAAICAYFPAVGGDRFCDSGDSGSVVFAMIPDEAGQLRAGRIFAKLATGNRNLVFGRHARDLGIVPPTTGLSYANCTHSVD